MANVAAGASDGTDSAALPPGAISLNALDAARELVELSRRWAEKLRPHYELEQGQRERMSALYKRCETAQDMEWVAESLEDNFEATFGGLWRDDSGPLVAEMERAGEREPAERLASMVPSEGDLRQHRSTDEASDRELYLLRAVARAIAWGNQSDAGDDWWFWRLVGIAGLVLPLAAEVAAPADARQAVEQETTDADAAPNVARTLLIEAAATDGNRLVRLREAVVVLDLGKRPGFKYDTLKRRLDRARKRDGSDPSRLNQDNRARLYPLWYVEQWADELYPRPNAVPR